MSDQVLQIMRMVMKSAAAVAKKRPDLGLDPNLPLLREKHPEWFEDEEASPMPRWVN